jgi:hypothetical protein
MEGPFSGCQRARSGRAGIILLGEKGIGADPEFGERFEIFS